METKIDSSLKPLDSSSVLRKHLAKYGEVLNNKWYIPLDIAVYEIENRDKEWKTYSQLF